MNHRTLTFAAMALCAQMAVADIDVVCPQVEHLSNPIGIDAEQPRFGWQIQTSTPATVQKSWRIVVGTDSAQVAAGQGRVWTGRGRSPEPLVRYAGPALRPQTTYYWRVEVGTNHGKAQGQVCRFHTGMMGTHRWQGAWISDGQNIDERRAPYFRRTFQIGQPVRSAKLYIAAAGLYELFVNGRRVGDQLLSPLYTRFDRRILYVTHDVTHLLAPGRNAMGVVLGNGWYNHQALGVWDFHTAPWRNRPAFCLDLVLTMEDGTERVIPSDLAWRTSHGEVVANNIYTGEHRNFTLSQRGWSTPQYDDQAWRGVGYRTAPTQQITAQQAVPIRVDSTYRAAKLTRIDPTTWVYDFGQNMAGVTHLSLQGQRGTVLHIAHGERLHPDGRLDMGNIDIYYRGDREKDPFQTDIVTLSGEHDEYTTQFGYKGFRYVQVSASQPIEMNEDNLTALFIHSDVPSVGEIETSNPILSQLVHAARMSYLSNLMGLPTDCPQREKNGWTGDGHLAVEAGLYNFDAITVYEKWMADHRDEQQPNGVLPDIIPTCGWGYGTDNGLDWTSTIAIIPWALYVMRGDDTALRQCYHHIRRYVDYVERTSTSHLTTWGRGDWVPVSVGSNKELTSSIYFHEDARILAQAARLFGKTDDAEHYGQLANDIRQAINDKYLNRQTGQYASGTQTEQSMPLCWGIVPPECQALVAQRLREKVEQAQHHLDVGVLGCRALLTALCQYGHAETAYRVATQDSYPSWGYWVKNGATTLLENWRMGQNRDGSDNHMMFGEILAWCYRDLGGITPDPMEPGFRHIVLRPFFPQGLERFTARHRSPYGLISSGWTHSNGQVAYTAQVPPGSHATLRIPTGWRTADGQRELSLKSGTHSIQLTQE